MPIEEDKLYPHQRDMLRSIEKEAAFPFRYGRSMRLADLVIVGDDDVARLIDFKFHALPKDFGKTVILDSYYYSQTTTSTTDEPQDMDTILDALISEGIDYATKYRPMNLTVDNSYGKQDDATMRKRIADNVEKAINTGGFGYKALASTYANMYERNPEVDRAFDLMVLDEVHTMKKELERRNRKLSDGTFDTIGWPTVNKLEDCTCPFCKAGYPVRKHGKNY